MYFLSNLHENYILTGFVDSYCLVCDNYLRSEDEAFLHTEKPIHRKNMDAAIPLEKYKDDRIIKVKKGYYCTFCNILLSTTTKVGLHINDIKHRENKRALMVCRINNNVVAVDEAAITWESWHGIMDNTCVICNTEFDQDDIHWKDQSHILNLIQSRCEFGDKYVYRKVDEDTFFCLICGSAYSIYDKPTHHESSQHNIHYNSSVELKKKTPICPETKVNVAKNEPTQNIAKDKSEDADASSDLDRYNNDSAKPFTAVSVSKVESAAGTTTEAMTDKQTDLVVTEITAVDIEEFRKMVNSIKSEDLTSKNLDIKYDKTDISTKADETKDTITDEQNQKSTNNAHTASESLALYQYLHKNEFFVQDETDQFRCVLCETECRKEDEIAAHLNTLHHKIMHKKLKDALKKTRESVKKPDVRTCEPEDAKLLQLEKEISKPKETEPTSNEQGNNNSLSDIKEDNSSKLLDNLDKFQANGITIDFTFESARCKICKQSLEFKYSTLQQHIEECRKDKNSIGCSEVDNTKPKIDTSDKNKNYFRDSKEKTTKSKAIVKTKASGKVKNGNAKSKEKGSKAMIDALMSENYIVTLNNELYCNLCCVAIKRNIEDLSAHVSLSRHETKMLYKTQPETKPMKKVLSSDFLHTFSRIETNLCSDIVLNNSFVLRHYSFHCVKVDVEGYTCELCKITFYWNGDLLTQHLNSDEHKKKIADLYVVTSINGEFIREIFPEVYQCGFCNEMFDKWHSLEEHFSTIEHADARCHAEWSLQRWQIVVRSTKMVHVSNIHAVNFA